MENARQNNRGTRMTVTSQISFLQRVGSQVQNGAALCLILLGFFLVMPKVGAQVYLGSIQGQVTDPTGAVVSGAEITAENLETHFKTTVTSNGSGSFSLEGLNPGTYTVTFAAQGFKTATRKNVILTSGQNQELDFKAAIGSASDTVEVTAENTLLDTGSANIATTLSTQEVTDLPNEGRNPYVMATLAAGVINGGSGGYFQGHSSQYTNPFSGVAVQIAANGNGGHNRLTLDGIPNDPAERLSGPSYTGYVPSPEAVQEVKISSSIFDAQVGHGNGTVTDTIVRNGTNKFHGAAYYVFQNTYLNANLTQNKATTTVTPRGNDQLSQTGIVFDGPVVIPKVYNGHDKTFFMVSFERYQSHAVQTYSTRLPTAAELGGDFSALCSTFDNTGFCTSGIQLYQPNSPVDANGNRTAFFPNNNIASQINATGKALASYLPSPNINGVAISASNYNSFQNSYQSVYPSFIARVDQAITSKNKLNAIYFQAGLTQAFPFQGFSKGIPPAGYGYQVTRKTKGGSLDDVQQFSSSLVLDSRFGLLFHPFGLVYPGAQGFPLASISVAGTFPYASFPGTSMSDGYASLAAGAGGQISTDTTGSLEEILTKVVGHHSIKIGFEGNLIRYNVQNPQNGFGAFQFDRRFTQKNSVNVGIGGDPNSGDSFADELLGYASSLSYGINASYALQQIYMAPFIQDDWRATKKLTINLGLRYDYESPFTERFNKQVANFCTTCINPLQTSVSGLTLKGGLQYVTSGNRFPYPRDLNNIQPRVGLAYQLTPTTVLRAGFGIIYFNTLESPVGTGFSQSTSYNNYLSSAPVNSISNPFPNGVVLPTGSAGGLSTAVGQNVSFDDPNHVQPKSAQYTANVQQQFPANFALQIAYVGAKPTRLEVNHNINILPAQYYNQGAAEVGILNAKVTNPLAGLIPQSTTLNATQIQQNLLDLPFPEFGSVTENYSSIGSAPYNALQIQVSHPMKYHVSFQANFTWDKIMNHAGYIDNYAAAIGKLQSVEDSSPTMFGNLYGTIALPKFLKQPAYERLTIGGWQLNSVVRMSNGFLIGAPGNVDIIGNPYQPGANLTRQFNTCYQSATITNNVAVYANVNTTYKSDGVTPNVIACDATSPNPAFRQRISYTSQSNSSVLNIRTHLHPLVDASLFKQFIIREGVSFEIRGEFFNVFNTVEPPGPAGLGSSNAGSSYSTPSPLYPHGYISQPNDARMGQLTARINF
jgi:hypothetical protein